MNEPLSLEAIPPTTASVRHAAALTVVRMAIRTNATPDELRDVLGALGLIDVVP